MFKPIRWRDFPKDFVIIQIGFSLFGLSIALMIRGNLGTGPWSVFEVALAQISTIFRVVRGKTRTFRQWIEYVGHDHLHHRMARILGGPTQSVLFIYLLAICLGLNALLLRYAPPFMAILLLSQAFLIVVLVSVLEANGGNGKQEEGHERNVLAASPRKENRTVRFRRPAQSLPSSALRSYPSPLCPASASRL